MSDIQRAAQALRDSVAALPNVSAGPWHAHRQDVRAGGFEVCGIGTAPLDEEAAHIARTASPDVVTAVADLLDAISESVDVAKSAEALAALINRDAP